MNCALWLNRRKVYSADEIPDNLDIGSLCGYFRAGSLMEWLYEHNGEEYAKRLENVSADAPDLDKILTKVFGEKPLPYTELKGNPPKSGNNNPPAVSTSAQSFLYSSHNFASFANVLNYGSFGSFLAGSYRKGFGLWEWEWEWQKLLSGSFGFGSFGSYTRRQWEYLLRLFGKSGSFGSFGSFGKYSRLEDFLGSFGGIIPDEPQFFDQLDEYDRIMLECLRGCPLNRYGYGIHNI